MMIALPWMARSTSVSRRACETRLRSGGRKRARPTAAGKASWKATRVSMMSSTRKHWSPPREQLASPHSVRKPRLKTPVRELDICLNPCGNSISGIDTTSAELT